MLLVVPGTNAGVPTTTPLRVHAGGLVWVGPHLHVAATARGFWTCRLTDLLRVPDDLLDEHFGYRYVLPVRFAHHAGHDEGVEPLRYSFLSLDRSREPARLVVGEYARGRQTRRLARFELDPSTGLPTLGEDGTSAPRAARGSATDAGRGRGRRHLGRDVLARPVVAGVDLHRPTRRPGRATLVDAHGT